MPTSEPRRFAYVLEFARRQGYEGTPEQQTAIRGWMAERVTFGGTFDRTMWTLAKVVKTQTPFVSVEFHPNISAHANWATIYLSLDAAGEEMLSTFAHELGHVVGLNFLYDRSEGFAELFKAWAWNGAHQQISGDTHPIWERIGPVVARHTPGRFA